MTTRETAQRQSVIRQSVLLAVALSCLVVGGQGRADFYDGKMLLQDCQGGDDQQETQNFAGLSQWGTCVGYIAAVVDTMSNAFLTAKSVNAQQVCVSEHVQLSQLKDSAALANRPSREAAFGGELTCLSGAQGNVSLQLAAHSHHSGDARAKADKL